MLLWGGCVAMMWACVAMVWVCVAMGWVLSSQYLFPLALLLSLVVQLARDLQVDFYPYFREFFPLLVSISDCQDAAVIEVRGV